MKILILGGTIFLGKHLVNSAVKSGHQVTLFNRGKHNPELFPEIEKLKGDRDGDLSALAGRKFDAVIDTCGYFPRIVKNSAEYLRDNVNNYTFISSISVFKDFGEMGMHEDSGIATIEDETMEQITGESYGPLKYLCEKTVNEIYKEKALIIRPGLIVGEDDPSDRFTYWIYRINQGGKVLAPGPKEKHVQFIDVQDLADFTIKLIEKKATGTYNATGPDYKLTFEKFIEECKNVAGSNAEIEWVDQNFLTEAEVAPYTELPLWLPDEMDGGNNCNVNKAVENGLTFRPLKETLSDTLNFINSYIDSKKDYILRSGLKPEREKELIDKWQNKV